MVGFQDNNNDNHNNSSSNNNNNNNNENNNNDNINNSPPALTQLVWTLTDMCGGFSSRCAARATLSAPINDKNVTDDSFGGDIDAQNTTDDNVGDDDQYNVDWYGW